MSSEATPLLSDLFRKAGLLDRLGETIPGLVYVFDLVERRNVFANRTAADLLGYTPIQVNEMGDNLLERIVHPDDLARAFAHHEEMTFLAGGAVVEIEFRIKAADGRWVWLHAWESVLTRDETGRTRQFLGIAHDVTARVQAEDDLRESKRQLVESEQRWRSIVENPFDFVVVIDSDYKYTFINFVAPGLKAEDLIGKATPFDFVAIDQHAAMQAAFRTVFKDGRSGSYEVFIPTLDKWYSSLVGPIRNGDVVTHASILTREITSEKLMQQQAAHAEQQVRRMEEKLSQSAKLEAVGQLAGGVAHDFNNLLTGISGITELMALRLDPTAENLADLGDLRDTVARGAGLTRQLLAFSRQQPLALVVIDLNVLLDESARMLRRLIPQGIELVFEKTDQAVFTRGDRTQIEQVILNLALNARDAMPNGGRLQVTLATVDVVTPHENIAARDGAYARLTFQDSGAGMDPATITRIFEPFFTTKAIGAGTGLGLSLVHGIVHQNAGFIQLRSEVGQGATFEIYLPCCAPHVGPQVKPASKQERGRETVLLVEDDELALRLTRRFLEMLGYKVECAGRGDEALGMIESGLAFDLLLTDVLLPGVDGHSLYQRAVGLRPGLPTVFMSGYTSDIFADKGIDTTGMWFLAKPFSHSELAEKLRAALGRIRA